MTNYLNQAIDPYSDPYGAEESETATPVSAVSDPWSGISGNEAGVDVQGKATAPTTDPYSIESLGNYNDPGAAARSGYRSPQAVNLRGGNQPLGRMALKAGVTTFGTAGAISGASAILGQHAAAYGTSTASGPGASVAAQHNMGYGGGEGGAQGTQQSSGLGTALSRGAQFYAGYQAAPLGAYYARESGDPSPYMAGNAEGGFFQGLGGRNDKEANKAHGERTSMTAAGFAAGAISGGWAGGIAGAAGAQFAENPYSGKRGYQEEWKYNIKPIGEGLGGEFKSLYSGTLPQKGNTLRTMSNMKNYGKVVDLHPGAGPKPPGKGEIKRDISRSMAERISSDIAVREWWNKVAEGGGRAGQEFVKSATNTEGRTRGTEEGLPDWLSGKWGSGNHPYDYRPEYINGKMVAPSNMGNQLAALQAEYERVGNKESFYNQYLKDYDIFKKGGTPISDTWHGHEMYNVPSEVGGMTFADIFPDLDTSKDLNDYEWMSQAQNQEENV
jgi:hypothetical protein